MHEDSMNNMRILVDKYLTENMIVVDIGSMDVGYGQSYKNLLPQNCTYYGADLSKGPNVDVVLTDPYIYPFEDSSVDVVMSGQALEHCDFFWVACQEMTRILKPGGRLFLIVPMAGDIHRYPVDCWRFYPDAYQAIASWCKLQLTDTWQSDNFWKDNVGAFVKNW
jgi:SAM-dependent methyltransferase